MAGSEPNDSPKSTFPLSDPAKDDIPAFRDLRRDFKRPPRSLQYETNAPMANIFIFKGTALKLVLQRVEFYVFFILHLLIVCLYYGELQGRVSLVGDLGVPLHKGWPQMSTNLALIPGALMSIFITFYVDQSFIRYFEQYFRNTYVTTLEIVNLLRNFVPDGDFANGHDVRFHLIKQVLAAQILGYSSLPTNRQLKIDQWAFQSLEDLHLMSAAKNEELKLIWDLGNTAAFSECLVGTSSGIWQQLKLKRITQLFKCLLLSKKVNQLRSELLHIHAYSSVPIPFSYYHLLNTFLTLYLALLAYVFAFEAPWWSIPAYLLILVSLLGFREIGNSMSDPFGINDNDLPVFSSVETTYREASLLLNRPCGTYVDQPDFLKH